MVLSWSGGQSVTVVQHQQICLIMSTDLIISSSSLTEHLRRILSWQLIYRWVVLVDVVSSGSRALCSRCDCSRLQSICSVMSETNPRQVYCDWDKSFWCQAGLSPSAHSAETCFTQIPRVLCLVHIADIDKTVLSCRRRWCELSLQQFSVVLNISETEQFCRVPSAVWTSLTS